ncbi:MAG TPA: hypothetical protein VJ924_14600 [Alphaproteobacteria bacterium]|nr:hypothetical protein [Alphaproteobacteria bacterium]
MTEPARIAAKSREQRRAEALRANLRRRKEQVRARAAAQGDDAKPDDEGR